MPKAPVRGTEIYYEVEGDGDWVVFAHGGEGTRIHWWQQVIAMRDQYRCVTYDARGFGSTPVGEMPDDVATLAADDLVALMDHVGIDRAVLIGHSMGGLAVGGVALARPERVRALVMCDTPFAFVTEALSQWSVRQIERVAAGFDVNDHFVAPDFAERDPAMHYLFGALNRLNPRWEGSGDISAYENWRDMDPGDYSNFSVPSLFLVGDQDELTDPELMRATAAAVNGAQFVEIEHSGHSAFAEQPDAVNRAILAFLGSR